MTTRTMYKYIVHVHILTCICDVHLLSILYMYISILYKYIVHVHILTCTCVYVMYMYLYVHVLMFYILYKYIY